MSSTVSTWKQLKESFQKFKKYIIIALFIAITIIDFLPTHLIFVNELVENNIKTALIYTMIFMILELVFEMYEKIMEKEIKVPKVESNKIDEEIFELVSKEKEIDIKYLGAAGRFGWRNVLNKFFDSDSPFFLLDKRDVIVNVRIALISKQVLTNFPKETMKLKDVETIRNEIEMTKNELDARGYKNVKISTYEYDHMPNFIGFLINKNYLYITAAEWKKYDGNFILKGGENTHFVYDKNDDKGGNMYIRIFESWFDYCTQKNQEKQD